MGHAIGDSEYVTFSNLPLGATRDTTTANFTGIRLSDLGQRPTSDDSAFAVDYVPDISPFLVNFRQRGRGATNHVDGVVILLDHSDHAHVSLIRRSGSFKDRSEEHTSE